MIEGRNSIWCLLVVAVVFIAAGCSKESAEHSIDAEDPVVAISNDELEAGQATYNLHCVSCHGRNLEGAAGVSLVDSEWLHGESLNDISSNIQVGFIDSGMPGFSDFLSESEVENLAKFIWSKRQGWGHVDYHIYPVSAEDEPGFSILETVEPVVSGSFKNGLADFERIEIPHFAVELEGPMNIPWDEPTALLFEEAGWTNANQNTKLMVEIDGEPVEPVNRGAWDWIYPVEAGTQNVKVLYFTSGPSAPGEDWTMWHKSSARVFAVRADGSAKLAPLSRLAKIDMEDSVVEVVVDDRPEVVRLRTLDLPSYSVNVGLANRLSYAFNTRSCAIVGLWEGEFLDIGPNVIGRGKEASEIMGEWAFRFPNVLTIKNDNGAACEFEKYTRGDTPAFYFSRNGRDYRMVAQASPNGVRIEFSSKTIEPTSDIELIIPDMEAFSVKQTEVEQSASNGFTPLTAVIIERR